MRRLVVVHAQFNGVMLPGTRRCHGVDVATGRTEQGDDSIAILLTGPTDLLAHGHGLGGTSALEGRSSGIVADGRGNLVQSSAVDRFHERVGHRWSQSDGSTFVGTAARVPTPAVLARCT
jgi:hypothetical protein